MNFLNRARILTIKFINLQTLDHTDNDWLWHKTKKRVLVVKMSVAKKKIVKEIIHIMMQGSGIILKSLNLEFIKFNYRNLCGNLCKKYYQSLRSIKDRWCKA